MADKTNSRPKKPKGNLQAIQWWQQYARSFVTPYREAEKAPDPSKIFNRLQPFTCEWFSSPDVALSEYSHTMTANIPLLEKHGEKILNETLAPQIKSYFEPIWQSTNALNKTNNKASPTITDAKNVLCFMLDNDKLDKEVEKVFKVSKGMFTMATNYLVATSIVRHPKQFSQLQIGENNSEVASFRQLGDVLINEKVCTTSFQRTEQ